MINFPRSVASMLAAVKNLQSSKRQFGSTLALPVANEFVIVVYLPFVFSRVSTDAWPRARTCSDFPFLSFPFLAVSPTAK